VTSQTDQDGSTSRIAGIFHEAEGQGVYIRLSFIASPEDFERLGGLAFARALVAGMERPFDLRASMTR
jgi:hypothetical protein